MDWSQSRRRVFVYVAGAVLIALFGLRALGGAGAGAEAQSVALDGGARQAEPPARARESAALIWVHVAGAVRRPGLHRVPADARAGAAVDAAGGLARRADLSAINLAAPVRDGQQIIVPVRGERAAAPPAAEGAVRTPENGETGAKLSLSSATVEQLDGLDGIGPTLAQRIVDWRDAHGGFQSVDQLREVDGIGDKRFEALKAAVQP